MKVQSLAEELAGTSYPGRGIVIGKSGKQSLRADAGTVKIRLIHSECGSIQCHAFDRTADLERKTDI